jgi:hypothetical protein
MASSSFARSFRSLSRSRCVAWGALAAALALTGCSGAPAPEPGDVADDEGELRFSDTPVDVLVGRAVITDVILTSTLKQSPAAKKVRATSRDPELSGGLVFLAGGEMNGIDYGVLCTDRDATCIVRWLARSDDVSEIAFAGQLGQRLRAVIPSVGRLEGEVAHVRCADQSCTLAGLDERSVTFEQRSVGLDAVRAFAGL